MRNSGKSFGFSGEQGVSTSKETCAISRGDGCKLTQPLFLVLVVCLFGSAAFGQPWDGGGVEGDPYLIYTPADMQGIGADPNYWDAHFELMADIGLGAYTGTSFNIIGTSSVRFTGVFDGNGHTISNFTYSTTSTNFIGLFGMVDGPNAEINNLGLINPDVDGYNKVGSLVGLLVAGRITNCYAEGGSVSGRGHMVGGLVGNNGGTITNCYSSASASTEDYYVGGLVGNSGGPIFNCYSTGSVSARYGSAGGLVGYNLNTIIANSYSTGSVTGGGGLVGGGFPDPVLNSFWDVETSGRATSVGGTGKTTAEMQDINTFLAAGWDFVNQADGPSDDWAEPAGGGYMILWWQLPEDQLPALPTFSGGTGTESEPYLISNGTDLNRIGHNPRLMAAHFKLINNIDLTGVDFFFIGSHGYPYSGVFNGNGHTISNFTYTSTATNNVGLFGAIAGENAEVSDLGLIAPDIDAGTGHVVGSLVGSLEGGTITGCYTEGASVSGDRVVGGLVGSSSGIISNCNSSGSVSGTRYNVGGLVGSSSGTITNCYSAGSVSGGGSGVGGLAGLNDSTITNCYSTATALGDSFVGGLVGSNGGAVIHCYSTGIVSGYSCVGGLVGFGRGGGTISNCYSTATVFGNNAVGGLVGDNRDGVINCYSVGSVTGVRDVGGLIGGGTEAVASYWDINTSGQATSAGGKGKTTAEMQTVSTFIGWGGCGNEGVWTLDEGNDYPRLLWENQAGQIISAQLSDFVAGAGTETNPYLIYTAEQLNLIGLFACEWDKHFKLMADIDFSGYSGTKFNIIGNDAAKFTGVFDGNGHTISNFTYSSTGGDEIGLFGFISGENAEVRDLGLVNPDIDAGTGDYVGSLVGWVEEGTISGCYVDGGSVSGYDNVGGLVGSNGGTVANCYSSGSVSGGGSGAGGLVGDNVGTISNCYSTGNVSGIGEVGGLVGTLRDGEISECYSAGSVSGESGVGGLLGYKEAGEITDSFWDTETSGQTTSAGGTGLITVLMQMAVIFTSYGWDFVDEIDNGYEDIWRLCVDGTSYPQLNWQFPLGDFVCPDGVDWADLSVLCGEWLFELIPADVVPDGGDGIVNFLDWAVFAESWQVTNDYEALADFTEQWLKTGSTYLIADIAPAPAGDEIVNWLDFAVLAEEWLD